MEGYQVATLEDVVETADIFITATGNKDVISAAQMARMKHQAIVGNIGHFDNEIDMAGLAKLDGIERIEIKPQVHEWRFADGHTIIVLSEGRLLNLGNATGHPSFVMSNSFTNQTIAQIELFTKTEEYDKQVYVLPEAPRREGRAPAPRRARRPPDRAHARAGRLHRRAGRGPLQAGPLSLLALVWLADRVGGRADARPPLDPRALRPRAARSTGVVVGACLHVTSETAVLVRTLQAGGADVALCASNPFATQQDVAAGAVGGGGGPRGRAGRVGRRRRRGRRARAADHAGRRRRPAGRAARRSAGPAGRDARRDRGDDHRPGAAARAGGRGRPGGAGDRRQRGAGRAGVQRSLRRRAVGAGRHRARDEPAARRADRRRARLRLDGARRRAARARASARR